MHKSSVKLPKTNHERILDLEFHLWELFRALSEVAKKDSYYIKNVATILRALVVEKPNNKRHVPLLASLANEYKVSLPINPYHIPLLHYDSEDDIENDTLTKFQRYVNKDSVGIWLDSDGTIVRRSLRDLVLAIAETDGLAHEDTSIEAWVREYKQRSGKLGRPAEMYLYQGGFRILQMGLDFLIYLCKEGHFELSRPWGELDFQDLKTSLFDF